MEQMNEMSLSDILKKYEIKISPKKIELLEKYCSLLWEKNAHLNLTRHTDYEKFVSRDLIDTLHLADLLQKGEHILDVGTGGGIPGIPLAILRPDLNVELCDSTGKKAEAVGNMLLELGLETNIWYAKAEELLKVHRFHTLVVRGVSKMPKLLQMFSTSWFAFDRLLMIKGQHWVDERGESRHLGLLRTIALRKLDEYMNPGADFPSVILQCCQKSRFEEIKRRDEMRLEGKPIEIPVENIGVDNKPREKKKPIKFRSSEKKPVEKKRFSDPEKKGKGWVHKEGSLKRPGKKPSRGGK
ncbi:MAG: 16S rRNA (guanine(527)-N(7))-methyltransferase RsmG [Planctomycetia bacterium]|nr:16S rRNA (guanine(527)-N(7))-methyltransferase RsmG [Planctomycetia bacterium]